ncbi:MAG: hypothetical protein WD357_05875 [Gracilimonas sp.]
MRRSDQYIIHFHPVGEIEHYRLDFQSSSSASEILESLKLENYQLYQLILSENRCVMSTAELNSQNIKYDLVTREKKTWFGLLSKTVQDLLIYPNNSFYYPYDFGNYLYLYTRRLISKTEFNDWLLDQFPNGSEDLDRMYAGHNEETINLLNSDDYLIITNHDYQKEFGINAEKAIIDKLKDKFREMRLSGFEEESYEFN